MRVGSTKGAYLKLPIVDPVIVRGVAEDQRRQ